jgi:hypothetical protein
VDIENNTIKLYKTVGSDEELEDQLIAKYDLTNNNQLQTLLDKIAASELGNDDFSRKIRFSIKKMLGKKNVKPYKRAPDTTGQFPLEAGYTGAYDNLNTKD